jgi:predicted ribosomally synthesized peptide with nif11-like leader
LAVSQEAATRFRTRVNTDEALRRACETTVRTEAQMVAFAVGHGYDVTAEELRAQGGTSTRLGDSELRDVVGGLGQLVACDGSSKQPVASLAPSIDWFTAFRSTLLR